MIVSHAHKFLYFAVPKTATHSVRQLLIPHLGENDWQQQALYGRDVAPIADIAALGHGHISVRQIKPHLSEQQWSKYFKFAFVRNPYDRFVSVCAFLARNSHDFVGNETLWMTRALQTPAFQQRVLVRPQAEMLTNDEGALAVDYLGRFESLQESLNTICARIGLPPATLSVRNKSEHAHYSRLYDAHLKDLVTRFYAQDLALFDYQFQPDS